MAKVITKSNYRVVIEPKTFPYSFRRKSAEEIAEEEKSICQEIVKQVERHVDDIGRVSIDCDTDEICSHCKLDWDIAEDGTPNCCQDAINEFESAKASQVKS